MYAGVLAKLRELDPEFKGKQYPTVPQQMNKEALQQRWPFTTEMWADFAYKHFPVNDAAQEAAIALYQRAAKTMEAGKWDDGHKLLKELLTLYPQTRFVKEKQDAIEKTIKRIEEKQ
jgi:predicted Zn-dependent protease